MKNLILTLIIILTPLFSKACVCGLYLGIDSVDYMFIGKVISFNNIKVIDNNTYKKYYYKCYYLVKIEAVFKGELKIGDTIKIKPNFYGCGFAPEKPKIHYAFYAKEIEGDLKISKCSRTEKVHKREISIYKPKETKYGF